MNSGSRFDCDAILFDLDGVLVDSTRSVARQWRRWAEEHGIDPDWAVSLAHGVRTVDAVRLVAPELDAAAEAAKIEEREASDTENVEVMPGAAELLRSLSDNQWCIVTSGTRTVAASRLQAGHLPTPRVLLTAQDVRNGKPHPEPYLKGAELLGAEPKDCVVIEDAPAGIRAAHAGGMKVIALQTTYPRAELKEADAIVQTLANVRVTNQDGRLTLEV